MGQSNTTNPRRRRFLRAVNYWALQAGPPAEANDHGTPRKTPPPTQVEARRPVRPARRPPRHRRQRSGCASGACRSTIPMRVFAARRWHVWPTAPCSRPSCATKPTTSTREQAIARAAMLAESGDERAALSAVAALSALGRHRELASAARGSALESVRKAAVEQLTDAKALGSIARHAADADTRLLAVARITDPTELEAVASRGEHADAAVAALERLESPSDEVLSGLAQRARAKAVQKRARVMLRAREQSAAPAPEAPAVDYRDADQQRARDLAGQMEAIGAAPDITAVRQTYAALRVAWVELLADAEVRPEHVTRFEQLSDVVRERLAADEAERAAAERRAQELAREQAERAAVVRRHRKPSRRRRARPAGASRARRGKACRRCRTRGRPSCSSASTRRAARPSGATSVASRHGSCWRRRPRWSPRLKRSRTTPTIRPFARSGTRSRSSGRRSRASPRSIRSSPPATTRAAEALEPREQEHREGRMKAQQENLHRLQAVVQDLETRGAVRESHAQGRREDSERRQARDRHHGAAARSSRIATT